MDITAGRRAGDGGLIMRQVILNKEPVELYKILKFEGLVPSGGVAKMAIESGDVTVNGVVETRKRKKMVAGDVIEFNGEEIRLVLAG
jgi:ribosome-associated protein